MAGEAQRPILPEDNPPFVDSGSIAYNWAEFEQSYVRYQINKATRLACRASFYAGCGAMHDILVPLLSNPGIPWRAKQERLEALEAEFKRYAGLEPEQ
jgi:hypothetical protein